MHLRPALLSLLAASALAAPAALAGTPAPTPQVVDPAGDANLLNGQAEDSTGPLAGNNVTPVGSQAYADVVSVLWAPKTVTKNKKKKVVGFTVTTTLSAPPAPPAGTNLVYRMLSVVKGDSTKYLGPVYYTSPTGTPAQSALRDNLGADGATRLTPLALPTIAGNTMTWDIPLTAVPKEFTLGSSVTNLYFEVRELESFQGAAVPAGVPTYGGATGLAVGILDNGTSTSSFQVG